MNESLTRRQALALMGGIGAAALIYGTGCARRTPTRPTSIWSPEPGRAFSLVNSTLIDVASGKALAGKAVLVEGGLIKGVYDVGAPELAGSRRIDCNGTFMIPGLINAHCHLNMPSVMNVGFSDMGMAQDQIRRNYRDAVLWGVTTCRDMGAMPKVMARDRAAIDKGRMIGPRILTAMSIITVPNGYPDFTARVNWIVRSFIGDIVILVKNADEARDAVKKVRDCGADLTKIAFDDRSLLYGRDGLDVLTDAQADAIMDESTKLGMPVAAHHLYAGGLDRGLQFGVHSMEHVATDAAITDDQMKKIIDSRMPFVPTLTVGASLVFKSSGDPYNDDPFVNEMLAWRDNVQYAELPRHCTPALVKKSAQVKRFYENEEYALEKNKDVLSFNPKFATRLLAMASKNLQRLIAEGAVLGVGNDAGVPFDFPGMLHLEMALLVRMGMTNDQALRAATMVNAKIIGREDKCGEISQGRYADIVLLAANPLDDIKNAGLVKAVFKGGVLVSKAEDFKVAETTA